MLTATLLDGRLVLEGRAVSGSGRVLVLGGDGRPAVFDKDGTVVAVNGPLPAHAGLEAGGIGRSSVEVRWQFPSDPAAVVAISGTGWADLIMVTVADGDDPALAGSASLSGGAGADTLIGGPGNDTLRGGWGNDALYGGDGDDLLVGNAGDDLLDGGAGFDIAQLTGSDPVTVDLRLMTGQETGQGFDTLTGIEGVISGSANDSLTGDAGANWLDGGRGDDTLTGLGGDDIYFVDSTGDVIVEEADDGFDTVISVIDWTLGANLEALVLDGRRSLRGVGNSLDNLLTGNGASRLEGLAGADTLVGGGGDTLMGGSGDDLYLVGSGDLVIEYDGEGRDTVRSSASFTLLDGIEVLELIGSDAIDGRGNRGDNLIIGNDAANLLAGGGGVDTLIGGLGDDWYEADPDDLIIEEAGGGTDTLLIRAEMPLPDNVENLVIIGPGPLNATGNDLDNVITGNAWDNVLDGGAGADTLIGGYGNDTYIIDRWDTVIEDADGGYDTIRFDFDSFTLPANVEAAIYTGSGAAYLTGGGPGSRLEGGAGNDTLEGSGSSVLVGGAGNDTYFVGSGDRVIEAAGGGRDTVYASGHHDLDDHVEALILIGTATASLRGNAGGNLIIGNDAANILDGRGGADTLEGGGGGDLYIIRSGLEAVVELPGGGHDTVISALTWRLDPGIEVLMLSGEADIDGYGNEGDNLIIGNAGNNWLVGNGGHDTLMGGAGDDFYIWDGTDEIIELAGEGRDTMWSSVTATIAPNVEALQLGGTDPINAYGSGGNDLLVGNNADNILDGRGGVDRLRGGGGNDLYIVGPDDLVIELPGEGYDTIRSSAATYTLPDQVEVLEHVGAGRSLLYGNNLDNLILGGVGNDTLVGRGGADTLIGGAGDDVYHADALDTVIEAAGGGWDTLFTRASLILPDHVEELVLVEGGYAGRGNAANNTLRGNDGPNHLAAGNGHNTLIGGAGDDIYIIDSRDTVIEQPGGGHDHAFSQTSITLANGVEDLTLLGGLVGIGNALDNVIRGNDADNTLYGQAGNDTLFGGAGNDTLSGGAGNDLLFGGAGQDVFRFTRGVRTDMIADFERGLDRIELRGMVAGFNALDIRQNGAHALIRFDDSGDYIYLLNFDGGQLQASDFIFA